MKIAFIGCGNMGKAIATALISNRVAIPDDICVADIELSKLERLRDELGVRITLSNTKAIEGADVVLLAVKPQVLSQVMPEMAGMVSPSSVILSIIAGKSMDTIVKGFKHDVVVRAMPNTPSQIGKGITVWTTTKEVSPAQRDMAEDIIDVMGKGVFTECEDYLDMATAVSGSGPAYVFLFMELLQAAAVSIGIANDVARDLVMQTFLGSVEYALSGEKDLAELRSNVTSPGGTTAAALKVFQEKDLSGIIREAVAAAFRRAIELRSI